jgi:DNA mismatch endonuclease (patch repair protein)
MSAGPPSASIENMADTLSKTERSLRMSLIKGVNTRPEMIVRRLVHAMGFRYRLHVRSLAGAPDLVFPRLRKIILVHGCFWHRHADPACKLARLPKSRVAFWTLKLSANRRRDCKNRGPAPPIGILSMVAFGDSDSRQLVIQSE